MNFWQKIQYYTLIGMCKVVGRLPYRVLYFWFVDFVYFLLYKVVHYRLKVVRTNLANSFPEKTEQERANIERGFYKNLSEVFIDTMVLCALPIERFRKKFDVVNAAEQEVRMKGQTWLCAMAHYGSWEYTSTYKLSTDHNVIGVYRPLHNKVFDRFYLYSRSRCGANPVPMEMIAKKIISTKKNNEPPLSVALIGDQTPPRHAINHWFNFLNQPTPFFLGTEKLALKFKLPVYFLHIKKVKRGFYKGEFIELYDGTEPVSEFEITERYISMLEKMIYEAPELWLWSHKRWKHKPI